MRFLGSRNWEIKPVYFDEQQRKWKVVVIHRGTTYDVEYEVDNGSLGKPNVVGYENIPIPKDVLNKIQRKITKIMSLFQRHADHYHELAKHWLINNDERPQVELARERERLGLVKRRN